MALTTKYDPIFRRHGGRLPVAFLRALAYEESGLNPRAVNPGSENAARGLMQVVGVVRQDYNERNGTSYTPADLLDPDISVKLAANLMNRVIGYYAKHPDPNLHEDWSNPEFVKLLVAGWNAGYSSGGGLQKVANYLKQRGIPVTHDNVYQYASAAGAVSYLSDPKRQAWQRSVADLFYAQPDWRSGAGSAILPVLLVGFVTWGAFRLLG